MYFKPYNRNRLTEGQVLPRKTSFISCGRNLFDIDNIISGYNLNSSGDAVVSAGNCISNYMPCQAGDVIGISYGSGTPLTSVRVVLYNSALTKLQTISDFASGKVIPHPSAAYFRLAITLTVANNLLLVQYGAITAYESYMPSEYVHLLGGKTIVCFGDSITEDIGEDDGYTFWMERITGANVINQGYGGTSVDEHADPNFDAFGPTRLIASKLTDTWTLQDAAIANWAASEDEADNQRAVDWVTQLNKLKALDFNDVDVVTLMYGANSSGSTIGETAAPDVNLATFAGAYSYLVQQLQTAYVELGIVIFAPMYREMVEDRTALLVGGAKMVAAYYNVPIYDTYANAGFNAINFQTTYSADGTHPTDKGKKRLGEKFSAFLAANI